MKILTLTTQSRCRPRHRAARLLPALALLSLSACAGQDEVAAVQPPLSEPVLAEPVDLALACPPPVATSDDGIGGTGCPAHLN